MKKRALSFLLALCMLLTLLPVSASAFLQEEVASDLNITDKSDAEGAQSSKLDFVEPIDVLNINGVDNETEGDAFATSLDNGGLATLLSTVTVYRQKDDRWSSYPYGYKDEAKTQATDIGYSGCGLLAYTNAVYYLNGSFIQPQTLADYALTYGHRVHGVGTAYSLYKSFADSQGSTYGIAYAGYVSDYASLRANLQSGYVAICSIPGHIMAIVDYNSSNSTYLLLDSSPNSSRGTSSGYAWKEEGQLIAMGLKQDFYILKSTNSSSHTGGGGNTGGGGGNTGGNASVPEPQILLDAASSPAQGQLYVKGWAYDPDKKDQSLEIHIYAGDAGNYGSHIATVTANRSRPDVNGRFPGVGDNHGFEETLNVSINGAYSIRAAAIGINGAGNNDGINTFSNHIDASISQAQEQVVVSNHGSNPSPAPPPSSDYLFNPMIFNDDYYYAARLELRSMSVEQRREHWRNHGINESAATPVFHADWYKSFYSSELGGYSNAGAAEHFVTYGVHEGRRSSEEFAINDYKANYKDLQNAFSNDNYQYCVHYINYGRAEGRVANHRLTISFDANGGQNSANSMYYTCFDALGALPSATRDCYDFLGWYTEREGGLKVTAETVAPWPDDSGLTLYAHWSAKTFQVTLNPNGGEVSLGNISVRYGETYGALPTPVKDACAFDGWYTAQSGGSLITQGSASPSGNCTLYAHWRINQATITARLNGGTYNGSAADFSITKTVGETVNFLPPERDGYDFVGWRLVSGLTGYQLRPWGTPLIADPTFSSSDAGATTYSRTEATKLSFVGKSADCPTDSGRMLQIQVSGETYPGLGGYYQLTYPDYGKTFYHVIVAKIPVGYTINFAHNEAPNGTVFEWLTPREGTGNFETYVYRTIWPDSGVMGSFGHVYLTGETATASNPVTWYVGYSQMFDATGIAYEKKWGTPLFSDSTFSGSYAGAITYNNAENGTVKLSLVEKSADCPTDSGRMMQIQVSGSAAPGLGGYYQPTNPECGKAFYHVIVAKIPVGYTINFAHNQAPDGTVFEWLTPREGTGEFKTYIYRAIWPNSGVMGSFGHVYLTGEAATESNPVTWYVGYSQMFDATSVLTVGEGDATLNAMWRRQCEITLDANGGSVSPDSVFISQNEPYGALPTPVRKGYVFDGWHTSKTYGTRITEGSGSVTANQTLYALWTLDDGSESLNGSGTETDPYQIFNQKDLLAVKRNLSAHYLLKSDIALTGLWTPIGLNADFDGVFDGGGHTISNLSIVYSDGTYAGLFGSNAGTIRNLTVIGTVSGGNDASSCAGVLAGKNDFGTILNCSTGGTITVSKNTAAGGLVGYLRGGSASGCASNVALHVSGYGRIGGLIGVADNSSDIINCYALGGVQAASPTAESVAGGLVGHLAYNSKATNCYAAGAVTADNGANGGLIGLNEGIVTASYFDMDASGQISANAGTPLSSALMKNQSVYSDWDFNAVWKTDSGINNGYPHLRGAAPAEEKKQSLVSIEIVSKPNKTSYEIGEAWNSAGLVIQAVYSDDTRETIADGFEISGFNASGAGQKTVTVTYQGKTATFNVTVRENAPVDSGAAQIAMENQSVSPGATFTVPVLLKGNPGVIGFSFAVEYDAEKLEYVSAADADFTGIAANVNADGNQLGVAFSSASKMNLTGETIVKLSFRAKSGTQGTAHLAFVLDEAFADGFSAFNPDTQENEPVPVSVKNAEISIADFIPGDVNGSGRVDNEDLILLTRYRARWKVSINMDAADVDGNGKVDNEDLIRLTRYRARWKITLLPGKVSAA